MYICSCCVRRYFMQKIFHAALHTAQPKMLPHCLFVLNLNAGGLKQFRTAFPCLTTSFCLQFKISLRKMKVDVGFSPPHLQFEYPDHKSLAVSCFGIKIHNKLNPRVRWIINSSDSYCAVLVLLDIFIFLGRLQIQHGATDCSIVCEHSLRCPKTAAHFTIISEMCKELEIGNHPTSLISTTTDGLHTHDWLIILQKTTLISCPPAYSPSSFRPLRSSCIH